MLIFGHPFIKNKIFKKVSSIQEIQENSQNHIMMLGLIASCLDLIEYCDKSREESAIRADNIKDAIFANALKINYILVPYSVSKEIQDVAQEYLFDSKILVEIRSEDKIEELAKYGIDGVAFESAFAI